MQMPPGFGGNGQTLSRLPATNIDYVSSSESLPTGSVAAVLDSLSSIFTRLNVDSFSSAANGSVLSWDSTQQKFVPSQFSLTPQQFQELLRQAYSGAARGTLLQKQSNGSFNAVTFLQAMNGSPGSVAGDVWVWSGTQWQLGSVLDLLTPEQITNAITPAVVGAQVPGVSLGLVRKKADQTLESVLPATFLSDAIPGVSPGIIQKSSGGFVSSVAFPALVDMPGITYQNDWLAVWAKWAQIAPKTYDIYFAALKPRNKTITDLQIVATFPITSVIDVVGTSFDSAVARLTGNTLKIQGTDGRFVDQGTMPAPSPSVIYHDASAQYVFFNQRVYVV